MSAVSNIQALADELEIRNLIARVSQIADDGELDDYVAAFTAEAIWEMRAPAGNAVRRGRADIRAGAQERRSQGLQGPGTRSRHMVTVAVVDLAGDTATAISSIMFVAMVEGKAQVGFVGKYDDELRRTPQGWKLSRRVVTPT